MKFLRCVCILVIICSLLSYKSTNQVDIIFEQNGKLIQAVNGIITLDKKEFNIIFNASEPFDVLVNASFDDDLQRMASNGRTLTTQDQFQENAIVAEELFNPSKSMFVAKDASSPWFYVDQSSHKFNNVISKNGSFICTRTIRNFFNLKSDKNIEISAIDAPIYLVFVAIKFGEDQKDYVEYNRMAVKIEWRNNENLVDEDSMMTSFTAVVNDLDLRGTPHVNNTNFDSFIDEDDYSEVSVNVLHLDKIYTDYFEADSEYRAIRNFKLKLSDNFYSVVLTVNDGDLEMETFLINYTLQGEIIAFKRIAYDNVLNASTRLTSTIKNNRLTINTVDTQKEKQETSEVFQIKENGKFMWLHNEASLLSSVIQQLNLKKEKVKTNLLVTKVMPGNPNLTIMVIPEIAYVDEDEQHFELNSYIVLVDNETGVIKNQYFESYTTNGWTSDAISMSKITLDTAPYMLADDTRAFGIRVHYVGQSRVNPHNKETLSLFVKSNDSLNKVLHNLVVKSYSGYWDDECIGVFKDVKSLIIMTKEKINNYYNIEVKSKIIETNNYTNETGDCISKDDTSTSKMILKYNNQTYR